MSYDGFGRKTSMVDPDMGTWNYTFDGAGNLQMQTDNSDQKICFTYDKLNRPKTKANCSTATQDLLATYTYDTGTSQIGRLTSVTDKLGTHSLTYDKIGRVKTETRSITGAPQSYTQSYTYDKLGRITKTIYPDGEHVNTTYNRQGLLATMTGTNQYVVDSQYNVFGQIKKIVLGNGLATWTGYYNKGAIGVAPDLYDAQLNEAANKKFFGRIYRICTAVATATTACEAPGDGVITNK